MRTLLGTLIALFVTMGAVSLRPQPGYAATGDSPLKPPAGHKGSIHSKTAHPRIQVALLLDTSNSMDGLIHQAKAELWGVVNEFARIRRGGHPPDLEVALYEYGNNGLSEVQGYIRLVLPFTSDLDRVSQELFALKTWGGSEFCGTVISRAVQQLDWSGRADDLKTIFIAGNEPFTQGPVPYRDACRKAVLRGITINAIHCQTAASAESTDWRNGALITDGGYVSIDHNRRAEYICAPQDRELEELGIKLNSTYIRFGTAGDAGSANQIAQDSNAASTGQGSSVNRAIAKASVHYRNSTWDLVDAVKNNEVDFRKLPEQDLPAEMQSMSQAQRETHVRTKAAEREQIQQRIRQLDKNRAEYLEAEKKKKGSTGVQTLDSAIIKSVREQAGKKNFVVAN